LALSNFSSSWRISIKNLIAFFIINPIRSGFYFFRKKSAIEELRRVMKGI
jgi:hypothetical protein